MKTGRIIEAHRTNYRVLVGEKVITAVVRGDFHQAKYFPVVGDYVKLTGTNTDAGVIEEIQERRSVIERQLADRDEVQTMVANVDVIFIVMGLDNDFNLNRLQRYLLLAKQANLPAVIVLNKKDLSSDYEERVRAVEELTQKSHPVYAVSAISDDGVKDLEKHLSGGKTGVLFGSSGAGKSTVINRLLGEERQTTAGVREKDARGRHTTTNRQLFTLHNGGCLIDTPGLRELGMVETGKDEEDLVFARIDELAKECKFRNCDHEKSDGCAVKEAIKEGEIKEEELLNYQKLIKERELKTAPYSASRYKDKNEIRSGRQRSVAYRKRRLGQM